MEEQGNHHNNHCQANETLCYQQRNNNKWLAFMEKIESKHQPLINYRPQ